MKTKKVEPIETKKYEVLKRFRRPGRGWQEVGTVIEMAEPEVRYLLPEGKVEVYKNTSKSKTETSKTEGSGE
ncbi:MAG: hypothetical protein BA863_09010 [Desulfovibrio sp. S3730MH75]|nr:MAG: hypothetical protein BA863_09010 [Desulfovibrio sp. S3730MH75]